MERTVRVTINGVDDRNRSISSTIEGNIVTIAIRKVCGCGCGEDIEYTEIKLTRKEAQSLLPIVI